MADIFNCPVCGKVGIEDYHSKDITCPCCGSDLSIFRTIDSIPEDLPSQKSIWKVVATVACFLIICLSVLCYNYNSTIQQCRSQIETDNQCMEEIQGKLSQLETQLKESQANSAVTTGFKYCVQHGDNLWKISRRFYGTGTRYTDIAEWNSMSVSGGITPGDTIILK